MPPPVPGREVGTRQTGVVVAHYATDDHDCAFVVVDTAALATPEGKRVISRAIAINRAINDRHRRGAAAGIIVNTASSIGGIIETDRCCCEWSLQRCLRNRRYKFLHHSRIERSCSERRSCQ